MSERDGPSTVAYEEDPSSGDERDSADGRSSPGGSPGSGSRSASSVELPLLEDEEVIVDTRPTWWAWAVHLAIAGLFALLGVAIATQDLAVGFFVLVLAAAVGGYAWYRRNRVRYLVTDRRIVVIAGFSTKTTSETWVEDVRGLRTKTTAFSRNQGYGTISVSHAISSGSFGWGNGLRLRGVPEFESVAAAIRRQQSRRK